MGRQDLSGIVAATLKSDSRPCNKDIDGAFACAQPLNMMANTPHKMKNDIGLAPMSFVESLLMALKLEYQEILRK